MIGTDALRGTPVLNCWRKPIPFKTVLGTEGSNVDPILDINLKGVMKTIQAVTPILRQQNSGRIVTKASVTGRMGTQRFPVYCASDSWLGMR
ncbi:SDR family oxidoreductase [Roseibium sp. SCP14]|uniref:SDR family oxidoreductase n=1 Tax=Roseibium sp. SCP14 TaxID=3141375 RepID=UPI00333AFF11